MVEIKVDYGGKSQSILVDMAATMRPRIANGLHRAGLRVEAQAKRNLSGRRNPGNPYPGVVTGRLRTSMTTRMDADGMAVRVGTNLVYAAIHEFGGQIAVTPKMRAFLHTKNMHLRNATQFINIPARPYLGPSFDQSREDVIRIIAKAVMP